MTSGTPLTVRIDDIPLEGRDIAVRQAFLEGRNLQGPFDTRKLELDIQGMIEADLHLERMDGILRVRGPVRFNFTMPCARSNEPVACRFDEPLDLTLQQASSRHPSPAGPGEEDSEGGEGVELSAADLDEWSYEGDELDLAPILYEHIALNLPVKVVAPRFQDAPPLTWQDPGQEGAGSFSALRSLKIKDPSGR